MLAEATAANDTVQEVVNRLTSAPLTTSSSSESFSNSANNPVIPAANSNSDNNPVIPAVVLHSNLNPNDSRRRNDRRSDNCGGNRARGYGCGRGGDDVCSSSGSGRGGGRSSGRYFSNKYRRNNHNNNHSNNND